ncbi:MAG TPA: pyruvate oxidoreductase subunit gamma [Firmicutes bacterium]|nr:pyruvate oxidoreductase subunit gamma [Bacillota bacterium]
MPENKRWKIIIAGEGGQGVQSIGELLAEAAFRSGKQALYIPNFGVEQRGGVSVAYVQIADGAIGAPKFQKADLLAVLSKRAAERTKGYLRPGSIYLYDQSALQALAIDDRSIGIQGYETVAPEGFAQMVGAETESPLEPPAKDQVRALGIPAAQVAKGELTTRVFNIIVLGAIVRLIQDLSLPQVEAAIEQKFREKFRSNPELRALNLQALTKGLAMVPVPTA